MLKQKLPTCLVLCQRNPHGHFEQFQTILQRFGSFSSVLNRFAEPKFGMFSNLSRPVEVAASQPSVRSRFVGVAG